MGKYNSSLTRVQPIFNSLYKTDNTGKSWIRDLLKMANRNTTNYSKNEIFNDFGVLTKEPQFEFQLNPPNGFLKWLINNPDKLSNPDKKYWDKLSKETIEKRRKLLRADMNIINEANKNIDTYAKYSRVWWILEGVTYVDCALLTTDCIILIEGKRTEFGASKEILWYKKRNQVIRNLECASEYSRIYKLKEFFVIAVLEKRLVEGDVFRQKEIETICSTNTVNDSLPHIAKEERKELMSHYLGVAYWEDIVNKFNLNKTHLD
jgi:hypothetical protein